MRNGYGVCHGDEMLSMFIFGEEPPPVDYGPLTNTGTYSRLSSKPCSLLNTLLEKQINSNLNTLIER